MYIFTYIYIYTYIHRERVIWRKNEGKKRKVKDGERKTDRYMYIYIDRQIGR